MTIKCPPRPTYSRHSTNAAKCGLASRQWLPSLVTPRPQRCCSGHCSHPDRSQCAESTGGSPSESLPPQCILISSPDLVMFHHPETPPKAISPQSETRPTFQRFPSDNDAVVAEILRHPHAARAFGKRRHCPSGWRVWWRTCAVCSARLGIRRRLTTAGYPRTVWNGTSPSRGINGRPIAHPQHCSA